MSRLIVDQPQPGFYKRKLTKGGPYIGVMLFYSCPFFFADDGNVTVERSRPLLCQVNGEWADPFTEWSWIAGNRITEAEFRYLLADADHAQQYRPAAPRANPRQTVDFMEFELPW